MMAKICTKCGVSKPMTAFHRGGRASDGRQSSCTDCRKSFSQTRAAEFQANPKSVDEKICTKCRMAYQVSEFPKDRTRADQLNPHCKTCKASETRKLNDQNKARAAISLPANAYCPICKTTKAETFFSRNKKNKNGLASCCKDCASRDRQKRYADNREGAIAYTAQWQRDNQEKVKAKWHKRRAIKKAAGGSFTDKEWKTVLARYAPDGRCPCCGQKRTLHADHVVPLSRGGSNDISNIQPLCGSCNSKKGTKIIDYREGAR